MKQQTELMRHILKNATAQRIIDFVSPIYGDSYVGLWLYEVIGFAIGEIAEIAEQLRYETNPNTTELLMSYWEEHYGLHPDSNMTMEQRRARLLDKIRYRAPANPKRLAAAMETVLGVPVDITERVAKNTFQVDILGAVADFKKLLHALDVLEKRKPAHLIYKVAADNPVDETDLKLAVATAQAESYHVGVEAIKLALQTTVEKAINMGAVITVGERFYIEPQTFTVETTIDLESNIWAAAPVTAREEYRIGEVKKAARTAVEAAFNLASPARSNE